MPGQRLTARERAVLAAVERRLSNPEIAAELFISVRTVESHIASLRRKLGADSRQELIAAAGERREREASVRLPRNAFVGRDADLAALAGLLGDHACVTVVGPGGVGKTRLALEYASRGELVPVVVELEHAEPGDVVARIARALDLEAGPGADAAAASVAVALASNPYLLVLDNVDRVGAAVAEIVERARASAPRLRVLTTSRTPIGDPGEVVYALAPLDIDGPDAAAVAMFLDRLGAGARTAVAPMTLSAAAPSPEDRALAARVCARLDGLPLAIELAAAVARHLSLDELAARLDRDFATLDRAAPLGRHRTLETAFEWTWDLLTPEEQDVLRRLGALPRTFDVDLAVAVTHQGAEGIVLRLLDHSMLVSAGGRPRRFRLLAVMRAFVQARTDPALIREVLGLHAEYHARVAGEFVSHAHTDDSAEAMHTSETLVPDLNAGARWAIAAGHPAALPLAVALAVIVEHYGSDVDSVRTLTMAAREERVLATASPQQLLELGIGLAFVDLHLVDELARLALARAVDPPGRLAAHHLAGLADAYLDRYSEALTQLAEAERLAIELDEPWQLAAVHQMRGVAYRHDTPPDVVRSVAEFEAAMRGYVRAGDAMHASNARFMMAFTAAEEGLDPERTAEWAAECVEYAQRTGNEHELAHAHLVQAMLQTDAATATPGESPTATAAALHADDLEELTSTFRRLGDLRCVGRSLLLRARLTDPAESVGLLEQALEAADAGREQVHQVRALTRLVGAHWARGDRLAALAALDRLAELAGADAAAAACPPELAAALPVTG